MSAREVIDEQFRAVEELVQRMESHAPVGKTSALEFRTDLGRLLVIAIVSAYETSVRAILVKRAEGYHDEFAHYVRVDCKFLNARISVFHLERLAGKFGPGPKRKFKREMKRLQGRFLKRTNNNLESTYDRLVERRNSLAHSTQIKVSIEEAVSWHRIAKHVIYAFDRSLRDK